VVEDDPRTRRRAARLADNRADILDAAERVFADKGPAVGSLRDIADASGFSTATIYKYFDNKQHLLAETLLRRATELNDQFHAATADAEDPMAKLHLIVDAAIEFFERYPHFRRLLRHTSSPDETLTTTITALANDDANLFVEILELVARAVRDGQDKHEIRDGNPFALTRLYMALVNEHVVISSDTTNPTDALTNDQFHSLIAGALRAPA
jgi:AcrR family transcriptional regulator